MDQQEKSEEKHELGAIHSISSMESTTRTEDLSRNFVFYEIGECTCEEPYVGKLQVRFCDGYGISHDAKNAKGEY